MRRGKKYLAGLLILTMASGCVTIPAGPSVTVLPPVDKPFDLFQFEDAKCREWAGQRIGMSPQEIADQETFSGAAVGAILGAGIGALLGAASGHAGGGAAIGAGTGLLVGSSAGAENARYYGREAQRRYDTAYIQCMYSYGNQLQQPTRIYRRYRTRAVPPPDDYYYEAPSYRPPPPNLPPPPER